MTIDGSSTNYSYNNSPIKIKIKDGKQYTITFSNIEGYTTPQSITYTAAAGLTRDLNLVYEEKPWGVRIVDLNGKLYKTSSWTGGSNATGVALINDKVSIIIAPKNWYTYNGSDYDGAWNGNKISAWGGYKKTVTDIKTTTSTSDAITDFAGSANTDAIISQLKGTTDNYSQDYTGAPAAEYCRAYSNGCKGVGQWYLPAAGEMNQIVLNRAAIEEALTAISGELFSSPGYEWTSTQYSSNYAWYSDWYGDYFHNTYKYDHCGVRPICKINPVFTYERNGGYKSTHEFIEGMTWHEFIESEYNIDNFTIYENNYIEFSDSGYILRYNNNYVLLTDIIRPVVYYASNGGFN